MGLRQCENCTEMVDEAKAFCPGCGIAFVEEEKRQKASEFEKSANTVQLGKTMYNQMLSDMGLNISKPATAKEKRIEVIAPVGEKPSSKKIKQEAIISPEVPASPSADSPVQPKSPSKLKWIVLVVLGSLLLFPIALLSAISLCYEIWTRLK